MNHKRMTGLVLIACVVSAYVWPGGWGSVWFGMGWLASFLWSDS